MGIISNLYNGEIFVAQERPDSQEYNDLAKQLEKLESEFLKDLSEEQKEMYEKVNDLRNEYIHMEMEQRFVTGFKMGAKLEREILG